jgi:DNA-directed RNA polymerase subunit RPC12/RpoP
MGKNNKKKTTEEFKKDIFNLVGDEFKLISEYKNVHTHVEIKHSKCGNILLIAPTHFLTGTRCRHCSYKNLGKSRRKTTESVKKEISKVSNDKYELVSDYKLSNEKLEIKHLECGNIFKMKYRFFVNMEQRCPICRLSKGEEKVKDWLVKNNFKFKQGFKFKDCRNTRPLPFDFAVFINKKIYLIEYDGQQHFEERFNFSSRSEKDSIENIQKRDEIKNNYCKINSINLLRISYKDYDSVEILLQKFFNGVQRLSRKGVDSSESK